MFVLHLQKQSVASFLYTHFSCICHTVKIASVVPFRGINPNCIAPVFTFFPTHVLSLSLHVPVTLLLCKTQIHIPLDLLSLWKLVANTTLPVIRHSPLSYYQIAQRCQPFHTAIFVSHKYFRYNFCGACCFTFLHYLRIFEISSFPINLQRPCTFSQVVALSHVFSWFSSFSIYCGCGA